MNENEKKSNPSGLAFLFGVFVRCRGGILRAVYGRAFTQKPLLAENRESFCEKVPYFTVIRMFG